MQKRRIAILMITVLLFVMLPLAAAATGSGHHVFDGAGLLTDSQASLLEKQAQRIEDTFGFGVYIVTLPGHQGSIEHFATDFYDSYGLGVGSKHHGAMLMLSMADRDYDMDFNGSKADEAFTEKARNRMEDRVLPYLGDNDYYRGFAEYLDCCEEFLQMAEDGEPYGSGRSGWGVFSAIPGAIAALMVSAGLKAPMKSVHNNINANTYAVQNSMELTEKDDHFLHRTVTRQVRQTSSGSSSGGSHHYSSGSHSGRSGKF